MLSLNDSEVLYLQVGEFGVGVPMSEAEGEVTSLETGFERLKLVYIG